MPNKSAPGNRLPPRVPDYELLRPIGRGSYGEVWLARSVLGTFRAVKIVERNKLPNAAAFEREFHGLERYEPISRRDESLLDIFHVGSSETDGCFYYVMELADAAGGEREKGGKGAGEKSVAVPSLPFPLSPLLPFNAVTYVPLTLKHDLQIRTRLPVVECVELGLALTTALRHLHENGLVHRDVKPSNIIFVAGRPKLADIGLVAMASERKSLVGTLGYLPPEGPGTAMADLFSLGRVLYEASTGQPQENFPALPTRVGADEEEDLAELNEVILRACAADARQRYASAAAMQSDLLLLQGGSSLRRLRQAERRLARLRKLAVAASLVALAAAMVLARERFQSHRLRALAEDARERVVRLNVAQGTKLMDEGDHFGSLVYFTEALQAEGGVAEREVNHRYRIAAVQQHGPRLLVLGKHDGPVEYGEFSSDGRFIATASRDHTARVWNANDGSPITPPLRHDGPVLMCVFNPDGSRLATCGEDGTGRFWDTRTGEAIGEPMRHEGSVEFIAFSRDGTRLATASDDDTARVWDARTAQPRSPPLRHDHDVDMVVFTDHGDRVVTCGKDQTARVWKTDSGTEVLSLTHSSRVRCALFSPDEKWIVTGDDDGAVRFWDVGTGQPALASLSHQEQVRCLEFSPDGQWLAAACGYFGTGGEVRVWDWRKGQPALRPRLFPQRVYHTAFSPDGRWLVSSGFDGASRLWPASDGATEGVALFHNRLVSNSAFSPDGRQLLTTSLDGTWKVWDLRSADGPAISFTIPNLSRMRFLPDGKRLAVIDRLGGGHLLDAATGAACEPAWKPYSAVASTNSVGPGAVMMAQTVKRMGASTGVISLWDASTRTLAGRYTNGYPLCDVVVSPNSQFAASFDEDEGIYGVRSRPRPTNAVNVWRLPGAVNVFPTLWQTQYMGGVAFTPDSQWLAVVCGDRKRNVPGELRLYSVATGRLVHEPWPTPSAAQRIACSPDGRRLAVGCADDLSEERQARLLDLTTMRWTGLPMPHRDSASVIAFSPDGRLLLTAGGNIARVWSAEDGRPISREIVMGGRGGSWGAFSADGRRVSTVSLDGTLRCWDAFTGEAITPAWRHESGVNTAAIGPDGTSIAVVDKNGGGYLWHSSSTALPVAELKALAELSSGRRLDRYGGMEPIPSGELHNLGQSLRAKHPDWFIDRK